MESKYQKYYDALKGKDFSSPISGYTSALSNAKTSITSAESIINSSQWVEKGLEIIKGSVMPSLNNQANQIENGITALNTAVGKINSLVGKLEALQSECDAYDSCEDEDDKNKHKDKINNLESEIDSLISEINGISFEFTNASSSFSTIMTDLKEATSLEAKKAEFLGSIDDNQYYTDPNYSKKSRTLTMFDNTTGEILGSGDVLNLKKGETRILTVKLPVEGGHIDQIVRTSAWQPSGTRVVSTRSDVNPDPNVVEYVNDQNNVWPSDRSILHANSYDWIITANETGSVQISQTCLYTRQEGGPRPKAMVAIHVNVTD